MLVPVLLSWFWMLIQGQSLDHDSWTDQAVLSDGLCRYGNGVECCWGWRRTDRGRCQPDCQQGCKHGDCVGPDRCKCHPGYTGKACNQDLNECGVKPRPCKHRCMNTAGSYKCYCLDGFALQADGSCRNVRTCYHANCQYGCEVTKGEVRCTCPSPGLRLGPDRRSCVDVDECALGGAVCPRRRKCVNTFGSFFCKCHLGFKLTYVNGRYACIGILKVTLEPHRPRTTTPITTAAPTATVPPDAPTMTATVPPDAPTMTATVPPDAPTMTAMVPPDAPTMTATVPPDAPTMTATVPPDAPTMTATVPPDAPTMTTMVPPDAPTTVSSTSYQTTAALTTTVIATTSVAPSTVAMTTRFPTTQPATAVPTTPPTTSAHATPTAPPAPPHTTPTFAAEPTVAIATAWLPSSRSLVTTTLSNRINKEVTPRQRGDVHIPRQPGRNHVWEFDVELGSTAEDARDDPDVGELHCSFSHGLCDWISAREGDLAWDAVDGPAGGRFLSVPELKEGQRSIRGARLAVQMLPLWNHGDMCFSFSHWLTGHHLGVLQLFVRKKGQDQRYGSALWSRTGGHGWRKTEVTLETHSVDKVLIKAERRHGRRGQIAVDDVTLRRGACR
ncbi:nephronectin isoform 2-T3 [Anableps anableps]